MNTVLLPFNAITVIVNLSVYFFLDLSNRTETAAVRIPIILPAALCAQICGLFLVRFLQRKAALKGTLKVESEESCLKKQKLEKLTTGLFRSVFIGVVNIVLVLSIHYVVIILLGAPFLTHQTETFLLSVSLTFVNIVPFIVIKPSEKNMKFVFISEYETVSLWDRLLLQTPFKCHDNIEFFLVTNLYLVSFGAWFGAFFLKLDWLEPWKVYPVTSIVSLFAFNTLSHFLSFCYILKKMLF